jgi:hypothetical protein
MPARAPLRARRARLAAFALLAALSPAAAAAQGRTTETRSFQEGQGRLMAFYSAALTFSPVGAPRRIGPGRIGAALELGYIPQLSEEQRRVGDKPEATNLAPVLPRPRLYVGLPAGMMLEASWLPPVRVFDVKPNVVSLALQGPSAATRAVRVTPRLAFTAGTIEGAITCSEDLEDGGADLQEYYALVCYDRASEDHFEPRHVLGEVIGSLTAPRAGLVPYAGVGVRYDRTRLDIRVMKPVSGDRREPDPDQPILELRTTRPYLVAGASLARAGRLGGAGELFYAPGSLFTVRLLGSVDFESPEDATFGLRDVVVETPSFSRDVQPIFTARCALGGCHTARTAQFGLILEPGRSYDEIVNQPAFSSPDDDAVLVAPGDSLGSWLYRRLHRDPAVRADRPRMPLAATPLTPNQITTIGRWIEQGAQRN